MIPPLHHFYHIYADGKWQTPVSNHISALRQTKLEENLSSINIGFVGSPENISEAKEFLNQNNLDYVVVAEEPSGWEQVTLIPLHDFIQSHDGLVSYAHTKGAAHENPINDPWRLHMEYHNFVNWQLPVNALISGKLIAGCHWFETYQAQSPAPFYGGTFWWARIDALRQNEPPSCLARHDAEYWIGMLYKKFQLIKNETILDMSPNTLIGTQGPSTRWLPEFRQRRNKPSDLRFGNK